MKYTLIFIYRLLNSIFSILGIIAGGIYLVSLPIWMLFGYLFYGNDYFMEDPSEHAENIFEVICYPLNKFKEFIDNMDDNNIEFNFNKFFNNNFWK